MNSQKRWALRFENLQRAFNNLSKIASRFDAIRYKKLEVIKEIADGETLAEIEKEKEDLEIVRAAIIHYSEMVVDLIKKTLLDLFLEKAYFQGGTTPGALEIFKTGLETGWITQADSWKALINLRNSTSHEYISDPTEVVVLFQNKFISLIQEDLLPKLQKEYDKN